MSRKLYVWGILIVTSILFLTGCPDSPSGGSGSGGADTTAPTFGTPTIAPLAGGGTLTIPALSESGTLFWAAYSDGATAPADAAALVTAAKAAPSGSVVATSGMLGVPVTAGSAMATIIGLAASTAYDLYIVVQDGAENNSALSSAVNFTTLDGTSPPDTTAPTFGTPTVAPTAGGGALTIPALSENGTLFWAVYSDGATAPATAAALVTAAKAAPSGDVVATSGMLGVPVTAGSAMATIIGLAPSTAYDLYIVVQDSAENNSALSSAVNFTTLAGTSPPDKDAPTFNTPTIAPLAGGGTLTIPALSENGTLFWAVYTDGATAPVDPAALLTVVKAAPSSPVVATSGITGVSVTAGSATATISGLTAGTAYDLYLFVQDSSENNSTLSSAVNFTTLAGTSPPPSDTTAPTFNTPTIVAGANGGTLTIPSLSEGGTLYWAAYTAIGVGLFAPRNASDLVSAVQIASFGGATALGSTSGVAVTAGSPTVVIMSRMLMSDEMYTVYIVVQDAAGNNSALASTAMFTPLSPPDAPTITANAGDGRVVLNWGAIASGGGMYAVYRNSGVNIGSTPVKIGTASATTYTDSTVTNGGMYTYVVRTLHSNGVLESPNSNIQTVFPRAALPAPANLQASDRGSGRVELTWTAPAGNVAHYILRRSAGSTYDSSNSVVVADNIDAFHSTSAYEDTTLTTSGTYTYAVFAVDRNGVESAASNSATITITVS